MGNAVVDATYSCPASSNDAPYQLHASVDAHNPTSSAITIRSVTAVLKLEAVKGEWIEKVGDTYEAGNATFTPGSVAAGANTTIMVTIASACTSGKSTTAASSYGDYLVTLHITTSAGAFTMTSTNRHRLLAT